MNIYPKTCRNFVGIETLMPFIKKYGGVELQFFDETKGQILAPFEFKSRIDALVEMVPELKEVTIHPPLSHYDIEQVMAKDINILKRQFEELVEISNKHNIKVNMVYHTMIDFDYHKAVTLDKLRELLKILEGSNVKIVLENIFMFMEKKCTVYQIAEALNHPNLFCCFDICHLHCRANIVKKDVLEYAREYLDKDLCKKYTYQVHFSYTGNDDGYVDKKTHGIGHTNVEDLRKDYQILKEFNMTDCNIITEVAEDDYSSRKDQFKELVMLEMVANEK